MKPLVVMALEGESQGRVEALGFEVAYCGVGKVNAAYRLTRALARGRPYSYVLNLGSAGSHAFARGALVQADRFVQRDMDVSGLGFALGHTPFEDTPPMIMCKARFSLQKGVCGSGDSFLQGPSPVACDMVDMEAFALAKVCLHENIDFAAVKYITDGADDAASGHWQEELKNAPQAFAEFLAGISGD